MKILVTGGYGFLGGYMVDLLRKEGYDPVLLVRTQRPSENSQLVFSNLETLAANHPRFDVIYHLAAYIPYGAMHQDDNRLQSDNVDFTQQLTAQYPGARLVFASSVSVYGSNGERPLKIHSAPMDAGAYGRSKLLAEEIVQQLKSYAIVRFSSIIGPGMPAVSFIPKVVEKAKTEGVISLLGTGSRLQNYIDVRDAARLLFCCGSSKFNLKMLGIGTQSYSNNDVATCIAALIPAEIQYTGEDSSPHFSYHNDNMYELVGFMPTFTLAQSIKDMVSL